MKDLLLNNTFFSADFHFYHKKVIEYSNRPFKHVDEMNHTLITNINTTVKEEDHFFMLGDLAFVKTPGMLIEILRQIKCKNLYWIIGNHDKKMLVPEVKYYFKSVRDYQTITVENQYIVLFHFPILEFDKGHRGSWHLHAHTHGNLILPKELQNKRIADIGVDCWNYHPVSGIQLKERFKNCEDIKHH